MYNSKRIKIVKFFITIGAESRTRTGTGKNPKDFKSFASTNSAIPARKLISFFKFMEAAPGFEPGIKVLQTHALPLGYAAACWPSCESAGTCAVESIPCFIIFSCNSSMSITGTEDCSVCSGFSFEAER